MKNISVKELKFVESYIETGNITQAAIVAGYSPDNANSAGNRLLKRDRVLNKLKALQEQLAAKYSYSRERMMEELEDVIKQASDGDYPNYAAILKAKEMQCKMLGFFDAGKIEVNIATSFAELAAGTPQGGAETDG